MRSVQKEKGGGGESLQYAREILKIISSFVSKLSLMAASPAAPSVRCISDLAMQVTVM